MTQEEFTAAHQGSPMQRGRRRGVRGASAARRQPCAHLGPERDAAPELTAALRETA